MANGGDDRQPSWSSWLAPGDSRRAEQHKLPKPDAERPPTVRHDPSSSQSQIQDNPRPGFNPLIAFKQFVDQSFAAITEFPENMAELTQAALDRAVVTQKMKDAAYERWAGPPGSRAYFIGEHGGKDYFTARPHIAESTGLVEHLIRNSEWVNRHVNSHKIMALFDDPEFNPFDHIEMDSPWPFCSHTPAISPHGYLSPSPTRWLSIDWFKHSPYSPVNLEVDPKLEKYDTKWRQSFEELLQAALDKPMNSQEKFGQRGDLSGAVSTWRGPGLDWMLSLQCRGILPPQLPSMYKNDYVTFRFFDEIRFAQMAEGRWGQQRHFLLPKHDLLLATSLGLEYAQLHEEIANPAPQDGSLNGHLTAEEQKIHSMMLEQRNIKRGRQIHSKWGWGMVDLEPAPIARCPDELGRAVGEAVGRSHEPDTELDMYEQLEVSSYGRCPDDLGRAVGDAARQRATRAFADEENGLSDARFEDFDFEKFLAADDEDESADATGGPKGTEHTDQEYQTQLLRFEHTRQAFQAQLSLLEQLKKKQILARSGQEDSEPAFDDEEEGLADDDAAWSNKKFIEECDQIADWVIDLEEEAKDMKAMIRNLDQQVQKLRAQAQDEANARSDEKPRPQMLEQDTTQVALAAPSSKQSDNDRPQVLSTLTTTQTTRLPDGSVKTTVVLKRRFADGAEETQESTQTSLDGSGASTGGGQESSKKGWFWS